MSTWTVKATIGPDVFTQQQDLDEEPTAPCLLSVEWSHELDPELNDTWPVPDLLTTATVTLLVAQASDAAHYDPTTVVHLEFFADAAATTVVDRFDGRGSFPTLDAHPLGVLVTITVVSYLLDLDAYMTGGAIMPAEEVDARLNREMGWGLGGTWVDLGARPVGPISLLELTRDTLYYGLSDDEVNPALPPRWTMYQLVPELDAAGNLDPVSPWGIERMDRRVYSTGPLVLAERTPGVWWLVADPAAPATAAYVIDSQYVAQNLHLGRDITKSVNTTHVTMADDSYVTATNHQEAGEYVIAARRDTELATYDQGLALAALLLPEGIDPSDWEADAFTVILDATPDGWYPQPIRTVMAIGNVPAMYHPEDLTYLVGVVSRVALSVSQGQALVTVKLDARLIAAPGPPDELTIDEVPQTIDSLDPSVTFDAIIHARP